MTSDEEKTDRQRPIGLKLRHVNWRNDKSCVEDQTCCIHANKLCFCSNDCDPSTIVLTTALAHTFLMIGKTEITGILVIDWDEMRACNQFIHKSHFTTEMMILVFGYAFMRFHF